jgi:iron complex transport system substrate-binding protein
MLRGGLITTAVGLAALACTAFMAPAFAQEPPRRVVSMNVCTDQLAMLVAGEGQLHSVSFLASDPGTSVMAAEAGKYAVNHGLAEEVFLMQPDLVLAGTYTAQPAVHMLRRLGFRVEQFDPEASFDDIRANLIRMGDLLGHPERAAKLVEDMNRQLRELENEKGPRLSVVLYSSNSYTSGMGSLSHAVINAAGLVNLADELGVVGYGRLPLEQLVLSEPDLVILGEQRYEHPALAQENFRHPAFTEVANSHRLVRIPDRYWVCGAPFTVEAVRLIKDAAVKTGSVH